MNHMKAKKAARILAIILVTVLILTSFSFVMFLPGVASAQNYAVYGADAGSSNSEAYLDSRMDTLERLIKEIRQNYKDDVSYKTMADGAFNGVLESLGDPFSVYYSTQEEGLQFVDDALGEYSGIGVSIESYNGRCRVVSPIAGSPAEKAGIRTGDIITGVDGADLSEKSLSQISDMLRGEAGTKVTLTIDRGGDILSIPVTREKIKSATVMGKMLDADMGYIRITQFGLNTHLEFKAERLKLLNRGASSLILDLRGNPGGVMETAIDIARQIMPAGPVLYYAQKGKIVETVTAPGAQGKTVPMVVLVNEGTASASEMLAGALQDSDTAKVVGTTTYGKGVAQQLAQLPGGAALKLSMYYFMTPGKRVIDHKGISPDYAVYNGLGLDAQKIEKIYGNLAPMSEKAKYEAGQTGLNVYGAQQRLLLLGFDTDVTGTMDVRTVTAVKSFQKEQGLSAYGGLDYATMNALTKAFGDYISGNGEDKQLQKAIELLK